MSNFVDRRLDGKNKSAVNRQRFIRRFKRQLKQNFSDTMLGRSVSSDGGGKIHIPKEDLSEPSFGHSKQGGRRQGVHPGNKEFITGDKVPRPQGGGAGDGAGNGNASNTGEGEDDFIFQLSREEFLDLFFDGLELPNLERKELATVFDMKTRRAGFTTSGNPGSLNVIRSMKTALARRKAMGAPYSGRLRTLEAELAKYAENDESPDVLSLKEEIARLRARIRALPFIDTLDLRYNHRVSDPQPTTQAVMFCVMDVSGSMGREHKDLAKRFFTLLYLFLRREYEKIDVVFIRHHTTAKEVDEEEFFNSRETGGTVVSSALEMVHDIIRRRYPSNAWNVYVAQASDGDNWASDCERCHELLTKHIMPLVQYYAYVEILPKQHQNLWETYEGIATECSNFALRQIDGPSHIYPVFRELFRKQQKGVAA